jgi:GntR family transcriptional regulator, transcriptional repressor for pyruvate dehydrogenase complex
LNKEVLAIKVVREVISLISTGIYAHGKKLPAERKLCEKLGVSRGTLRQGLADLESLGVIKIMSRSGAYVKKYSNKQLPQKILPPNFKEVNLADIINARKIIELPALEIACKNATKADINALKVLVDKMERTIDDLPKFLQSDAEFHQAIVAMSKNLVLVTAFESISEYLKYSQVYSSIHEGEEEKALDFHRNIFECIKRKDARGGVKMLERHLDEIMESSKS